MVSACPSYEDPFHTRPVPGKEKSVISIGWGGKEGICGFTLAGRRTQRLSD